MEDKSESVFSSFKDALLERFRSPLAGTLLISWVAVNWKILYILIWSDNTLPTKSRLELIRALHLFDSNWNLYYTPLILSFSYLLVYPWVGMGIKVVKRWYYEIDKKLQEKLFKNTLLSREESENISKRITRVNVENEQLRNENIRLVDENYSLKSTNRELRRENDELKPVLEPNGNITTETTLSSETGATSYSSEEHDGRTGEQIPLDDLPKKT